MPEETESGESVLPEDVRTLLRTCIDTHEKIEVLQLLQREPQREWHASELGQNLHIDVTLVEAACEALVSGGFARRTDGHCAYSPTDPAAAATGERLLQEYRERPLRIIQLISLYAIERVRTGALRAFADAFVVKKKPDRG